MYIHRYFYTHTYKPGEGEIYNVEYPVFGCAALGQQLRLRRVGEKVPENENGHEPLY
jgi:hypothetical protein